MDSISKFNWLSGIYSQYRPSYPESCIDAIFKKCWKSITTIADIGAWTWKLSLLFLKRWCEVYAIDPNNEMLNQACKDIWENTLFHPVLASAENTSLSNNSLDLIVVGQAFHWFNSKLFKEECKRILKSNCSIAILYNNWDKKAEIIKKIDELSKHYCPNYKGSSWGLEKQETLFSDFFDSYEKLIFNNDYHLNLEQFLWLNFSASYAPKQWEENYEAYLEALTRLFNEFSDWGVLNMLNNTILRIGNI